MSEGPNYRLEIIRLKHALQQMEGNLMKQTLDKMEALDRICKAVENEEGYKASIETTKVKLAELEKTHGPFGVDQVNDLVKQIS